MFEIGVCSFYSKKTYQNDSCKKGFKQLDLSIAHNKKRINLAINRDLILCFNCENWNSMGEPKQQVFMFQ